MKKWQSESDMEHIHRSGNGEKKLCEVAKHPFGIFIFYVQAGVGVLIGVGLAYFLLPSVLEDTAQAFLIANLFAAIVVILAIITVLLASLVYRQNRLTVTERNITQVLQYGLFHRKVSQLNMVNVEDVTSVQDGLLATMLGYGTLIIETAGEQANFKFTYCPRSGYYAKVILSAREKFLGQDSQDHHNTSTNHNYETSKH